MSVRRYIDRFSSANTFTHKRTEAHFLFIENDVTSHYCKASTRWRFENTTQSYLQNSNGRMPNISPISMVSFFFIKFCQT